MKIRYAPSQDPVSPDHTGRVTKSVPADHEEMITNVIEPIEITFTRPHFGRRCRLHFLIEDTIAERLRSVDFCICCRKTNGQIASVDRFESLAIQFGGRHMKIFPQYVGLSLLHATTILKNEIRMQVFSGRQITLFDFPFPDRCHRHWHLSARHKAQGDRLQGYNRVHGQFVF